MSQFISIVEFSGAVAEAYERWNVKQENKLILYVLFYHFVLAQNIHVVIVF